MFDVNPCALGSVGQPPTLSVPCKTRLRWQRRSVTPAAADSSRQGGGQPLDDEEEEQKSDAAAASCDARGVAVCVCRYGGGLLFTTSRIGHIVHALTSMLLSFFPP